MDLLLIYIHEVPSVYVFTAVSLQTTTDRELLVGFYNNFSVGLPSPMLSIAKRPYPPSSIMKGVLFSGLSAEPTCSRIAYILCQVFVGVWWHVVSLLGMHIDVCTHSARK